MAYNNTIELFKQYVPMLDEIFQEASMTGVLDGRNDLAREGARANELVIPKMDMSGLADYSRAEGYADGTVTLEYETKACNYDRGRMFQVDAMDNQESAGIAFGRLAGEFIRTKVVAEVDAFRLGQYASYAGIGSASGALADGVAVIEALRKAANLMDDVEVPYDQRYLFIRPNLISLTEDLDSYKSKAVLTRFAGVIRVPPRRMNTKVTLTDNGYTAEGDDINFLVVYKPSVIQFQKHAAVKVISPEQNQHADAWKFGYRIYGIAEALDNKLAGIYAHTAGASG